MARAFALATEAGRLGWLAGRGAVRGPAEAEASSPLTGFLADPAPPPAPVAARSGAPRPSAVPAPGAVPAAGR
jgi:thiazole synthase